MAKAELGKKRGCLSCNMRFYDFDRSPIICPGCGAEFDPQRYTKSQKSPRTPQAKTQLNKSTVEVDTVEVDKVTEVDVSDDLDFDENDVDVHGDDKDEPGIIQDDIGDDDELLPDLDTQD